MNIVSVLRAKRALILLRLTTENGGGNELGKRRTTYEFESGSQMSGSRGNNKQNNNPKIMTWSWR